MNGHTAAKTQWPRGGAGGNRREANKARFEALGGDVPGCWGCGYKAKERDERRNECGFDLHRRLKFWVLCLGWV